MIAENSTTSLTLASANTDADIQLALSCVLGQGQQRNVSRGAQLMRKAAVGGSKEAQFMLAKWYLPGGPLDPDESEAIFWLRRSADQGHEPAMTMLGQLGIVWRPSAQLHQPVQATRTTTTARASQMELVPAVPSVVPPAEPNPPNAQASKVRITRALIDEWTDDAEDYLNGGSRVAEVHQLLKERGCPPKMRDQVLRKAGDKVRARHRGEGLRSLVLGIGTAGAGVLFTLACTGQINLGGYVMYSVKGALVSAGMAAAGAVWAVTGVYKMLTGSAVEAAPPGWRSVD